MGFFVLIRATGSKLLCFRGESKTAAILQSADCNREGWAASRTLWLTKSELVADSPWGTYAPLCFSTSSLSLGRCQFANLE